MKLTLYPWQEECLQMWFSHHCRGIVNVVTGAGKTVLALSAAQRLRTTLTVPLRVKIIVPQIFLTSQWSASMQKQFGISRQEIGCYYGTHKDSPDHPYMIYVINSARYSLARHILEDVNNGCAVLLIADECHHYASRENRKIFEFLPLLKKNKNTYYSLGLSATPQTTGYRDYLIPALGPEIYRYTFENARLGNTIRPFVCFNISLSMDPEESANYQELSDRLNLTTTLLLKRCPELHRLNDAQFFQALKHLGRGDKHASVTAKLARTVLLLIYQRRSLMYSADSRKQCALSLIRQLSSDSRIIVFCERIQQADTLYHKLLEKYPNQTARYHSQLESDTRKLSLERFRTGECRILVTCRALDEGFDIPTANVGIVMSSSAVPRQRIQRLGRILRNTTGDGSIASLYYFYLENTTELPSYLESDKSVQDASFFLSYRNGAFFHPYYEELCISVLTRLKDCGKSASALAECRRCLSLGTIRSDWLPGSTELNSHITSAADTRSKNYWICMKWLAQEHQKRTEENTRS